MTLKTKFLIFLLLFSTSIFSQKIDFNISKLDSVINLADFDYDLINEAVIFYTNKHRKKHKKTKLNNNPILEKCALIHSLEMEKYNFFDHINKKSKKFRELNNRAKFVGYNNYKYLAENLFYGFINLSNLPTYKDISYEITNAFIESKSHNKNLLSKSPKEIGGNLVFKKEAKDGFLYYYYTQNFGAKFKN